MIGKIREKKLNFILRLRNFKNDVNKNIEFKKQVRNAKLYNNQTPADFFNWLRKNYIEDTNIYIEQAKKFIVNKNVNVLFGAMLNNAIKNNTMQQNFNTDGLLKENRDLTPDEINGSIKKYVLDNLNKNKVHGVLMARFLDENLKNSMLHIIRVYLLLELIQGFIKGYRANIGFFEFNKKRLFKFNSILFWNDVIYKILAPDDTLYYGEILNGGKKY